MYDERQHTHVTWIKPGSLCAVSTVNGTTVMTIKLTVVVRKANLIWVLTMWRAPQVLCVGVRASREGAIRDRQFSEKKLCIWCLTGRGKGPATLQVEAMTINQRVTHRHGLRGQMTCSGQFVPQLCSQTGNTYGDKWLPASSSSLCKSIAIRGIHLKVNWE